MKIIKKNILGQLGRGACLALAALTLIITFGSVTPAHTEDRYERGNESRWRGERWREHERHERNEWREHERHARHWRYEHRYRYYNEPEVIFAPPHPVYYGPPPRVYYSPPPPVYYDPPPLGINIVVPLHFR